MNKLATFSDLPPEIIQQLLNYLPPSGLLSLIRVVPQLVHFITPAHSAAIGESGETLLHLLAEDGDVKVLKVLLANPSTNPNIYAEMDITPTAELSLHNLRDPFYSGLRPHYHRRTPLSCAAAAGRLTVVELLLDHPDTYPDIPDYTRRTPLSLAAFEGHIGIVSLLLARTDVAPGRGFLYGHFHRPYDTPVMLAASQGHVEVVDMLLQQRPEMYPDVESECNLTALDAAAGHGHVSVVELILSLKDIDAGKVNAQAFTPLSYAAQSGHLHVVEILLGRPEVYDGRPGMCPVWHAVRHGFIEVAKLLLQRDLDSINETTLHLAAQNDHTEVMRMLLLRDDVDVNGQSIEGMTVLAVAAYSGSLGAVSLLLERSDINVNTADSWGRTPLMRAAENGRTEIMKLLLERDDLDVNVRSVRGMSALTYADEGGHVDAVALLMSTRGMTLAAHQ